jgi:hypothetical protein
MFDPACKQFVHLSQLDRHILLKMQPNNTPTLALDRTQVTQRLNLL